MSLRFSLLNAQGLISRRTNKLKSPELKNVFNNSDLVLFTETWTDDSSDLNVNDFEYFVLNRKLVKKQIVVEILEALSYMYEINLCQTIRYCSQARMIFYGLS